MKITFSIFLVGILLGSCLPIGVEELWEAWKSKYEKIYPILIEEQIRFDTFLKNYLYILEWNEANNTCKLGLNKFADKTQEEIKSMLTARSIPQSIMESSLGEYNNTHFPDSWDWRTKGAVTPIKDQLECGCCYAFSTIAAIEGAYVIEGNPLTSFSEQQIVDCDLKNHGCDGGYPYFAFSYIQAYGIETESQYPYQGEVHSCSYNSELVVKNVSGGYAFIAENVSAMKGAVYQQPVSVIIEADQNVFVFYKSGVITSNCGCLVDHAVAIIGYGNYEGIDSFIVKNSWGTDWGDEGYVYIGTSNTENYGAGVCCILSAGQVPILTN